MTSLLSVDSLSVVARTATGEYDAVRDVTFDVDRSSAVALVGESGSGKTMTALAIAGLLADNLDPKGSVRLDDTELLGMGTAARRKMAGRHIGYIFQEPMSSLHPILTVGQQMEEGLRAHFSMSKTERRDRVRELLATVGLAKTRDIAGHRIGQLSGGMRQRVMIAMAISCNPDLLIADEPTTALDVTLQKQITELLLKLREDLGLGLLLITHDLGVVAETCDTAAVMYGGQIVERGATKRVLADPSHDYTRALITAIPRIGDTRRRLPTVAETAPGLKDARLLPREARVPTRLVETEAGHWVRQEGDA